MPANLPNNENPKLPSSLLHKLTSMMSIARSQTETSQGLSAKSKSKKVRESAAGGAGGCCLNFPLKGGFEGLRAISG